WSVSGDHPAGAELLDRLSHPPNRGHLSPHDHLLQRSQLLDSFFDREVEERGGQEDCRYLMPSDDSPQHIQRWPLRRIEREAGAVQQRPPELKGRGVEGDGGEL